MNVQPPSNPARSRSIGSMPSSWGGLSSLLRPAATERRAASQRHTFWAGMARALRGRWAGPAFASAARRARRRRLPEQPALMFCTSRGLHQADAVLMSDMSRPLNPAWRLDHRSRGPRPTITD